MAWLLTNYKLVAYALAAIAIAVLAGRIHAWHDGYEREKATAKLLVAVTAERDAEVNCTTHSRCAEKLIQQAKEAQAAIAKAQQDAQANYERDKADQQKRQEAEKQKIRDDLKQTTSQRDSLVKRINDNRSNLACADTFHTVDPCFQ